MDSSVSRARWWGRSCSTTVHVPVPSIPAMLTCSMMWSPSRAGWSTSPSTPLVAGCHSVQYRAVVTTSNTASIGRSATKWWLTWGTIVLVLVGRADGLGDGDLRRLRRGAGRGHQGLQLRVGEELLEVLGGLPLVHHQDEAVADPEAVVDAGARGAGFRGHLRELLAVIGHRLAELGHITLELKGDNDAHEPSPLRCRPGRARVVSGVRHRFWRRISP